MSLVKLALLAATASYDSYDSSDFAYNETDVPRPFVPPSPSPPMARGKVTATFATAGEVADYNHALRSAIKAVIASAADVNPASVSLAVTAASVRIATTVVVANDAVATSTAASLASGIFASPAALQAALASGGVGGVVVTEITSAPVSTSSLLPGHIVPVQFFGQELDYLDFVFNLNKSRTTVLVGLSHLVVFARRRFRKDDLIQVLVPSLDPKWARLESMATNLATAGILLGLELSAAGLPDESTNCFDLKLSVYSCGGNCSSPVAYAREKWGTGQPLSDDSYGTAYGAVVANGYYSYDGGSYYSYDRGSYYSYDASAAGR